MELRATDLLEKLKGIDRLTDASSKRKIWKNIKQPALSFTMLKKTMWPNSTGETNQERKDFLWLPVLQWDSVHLLQLVSFMDQAFKMLEIHTDICTTCFSLCRVHTITMHHDNVTTPSCKGTGKYRMDTNRVYHKLTTFISCASSHDPCHDNSPGGFVFLNCCPLEDSDWGKKKKKKRMMRRGKEVKHEQWKQHVDLITAQTSFFIPLKAICIKTGPFSRLPSCNTQSAGKGYPNQHYFQQMLLMWSKSQWKEHLM